MCWSRNSKTLSWLGILWGLLSLATLLTAFLSNVWLYTKEPIRFPNSDALTTVTFKIGLWRICPSLKLTNATPHTPHLSCTAIKYSSWEDITATDLGISTPLEFTPSFLSKMRISTLFGAVSIILIFLATAFAFVGVFSSDHKTIVACGLFILGGLTLGGGLLIFASVLSDAYFERPKRSHVIGGPFEKMASSALFDYNYGWSFFAAGAAFFMTELAAVLSISAYVRRFPTVEDMVRIMVPGAERRLKVHHGLAGEYLVQHKNKYQRPDPDTAVTLTSGSKCKASALTESDLEAVEGDLFLTKPAPDICSSNPAAPPETTITFHRPPRHPPDALILGSSFVGPPPADTVPIVLMHNSQRPPGPPFTLSAPNSKRNFKMSALPDPSKLPFSPGLPEGEICFEQSFYPNQCTGFQERLNEVSLRHLEENQVGFFGTFHGDRSERDVPGTFSTTSSSSGTGSGTTVTVDSSQSGVSRKREMPGERKKGKSVTIGSVFSNMETVESGREEGFFECRGGLG